uniref:NADH dehydrogenase subunit 6 n=1 Tax=Juglanconis oblonga TaxID=1940568 RepID=A0A291LJB4_9PEZI|nr:NADH dehydrogenase subunit 6 [Juglanconis oblonga]ATI20420.1 NADH dehydrogenase subunit 6 [Juglanconis oblonga]
MNNLFLVKETFTDGYIANILNIISLFAILCGVLVIISKNPVVSVLFLIGLFGNISGYLILIGLGFMGLAYLVVYVGAISILFLFILMLINIRISELQSNTLNTIPLAITISIALNYPLFKLLPYDLAILSNNYYMNNILYDISLNKYNLNYFNNLNNFKSDGLSFVSSNKWDGNLAETGHIASIGSVLYTNYNMWLLIASFILLLAMVGVLVIVIKQPNAQSFSSGGGSSSTMKSTLFNGDQKRSFHSNRRIGGGLVLIKDNSPSISLKDYTNSKISTFKFASFVVSKGYASSSNTELRQDTLSQWYRIFKEPFQNSHKLAVEFIQSGIPITADHINKILAIFDISVTDNGLRSLINLPRLTYNNLSRSLLSNPEFLCDLGKVRGREVVGVYIFTHHDTGAKYVGSSIQLTTRLQRYFNQTSRVYGKFIPFLLKEGIEKFRLEIIITESSDIFKAELILEQYYLLNSMLNLNTSRVINMPGDTSKKVFMYNADKTGLIFSSNSFKDLYLKFGVWHQAIINAIRTGSLYLGKYVITTVPILTAKSGNFSEEDVIAMLAEDRKNSFLYLYNTDKSLLYFKGLK